MYNCFEEKATIFRGRIWLPKVGYSAVGARIPHPYSIWMLRGCSVKVPTIQNQTWVAQTILYENLSLHKNGLG